MGLSDSVTTLSCLREGGKKKKKPGIEKYVEEREKQPNTKMLSFLIDRLFLVHSLSKTLKS